MKKRTVISLILATSLMIAGIAIFAGVMTMLKWNFKNLSTAKYETNEYTTDSSFTDIVISDSTSDVSFVLYSGDECKVVCLEDTRFPHTVAVDGSSLIISASPARKWYHNIGLSFSSPKISVFLPKSEYSSLFVDVSTGSIEIPTDFHFENAKISLSTGDIHFKARVSGELLVDLTTGDCKISGVSAGKIDVKTTTGDIKLEAVECATDIKVKLSTGECELEGVRCQSLYSNGTTGDISLENVKAEQMISVERNTGDVELQGADANEIYVKTTSGSVEGFLYSEKIFSAHSTTGSIRVPNTSQGGICKITTTTGDIDIRIK